MENDTGIMAYRIMPGSRLSLTCMGNLRVVKYESDYTFDPLKSSDPDPKWGAVLFVHTSSSARHGIDCKSRITLCI